MSNKIELPLPPSKDQFVEMEIYARFMQHLRRVPHRRMDVKILSSIQFTADMLDYNDAQIAKVLVDLGLRVGRAALPMDYIEFADASLMRSGWDVGGPTEALFSLKSFWDDNGEDRFAGFKHEYAIHCEDTIMGCV
ncbi:MAG: hypothetical protein AB8B83_00400 [Bdellovibrionales bacterium]